MNRSTDAGVTKQWWEAAPLLWFVPFLVLFSALVLRLHTDQMFGDEGRYYQFAQNLSHGFYSSPAPGINLWSGPGYPLFLLPFVVVDAPLIGITLANAVLQYLSIVLLYATVRRYLPVPHAVIVALFWATYYISYQELPSMLSEPLAVFLIALFGYLFVRAVAGSRVRDAWLAGVVLGLLSLTKIVFGYVVLACLAVAVVGLVVRAERSRRVAMVFAVALAINVPYLVYTQQLTGKWLYWGNAGGAQLYWMSTPFAGEFGDWNGPNFDANCLPGAATPCNAPLIAANHRDEVAAVMALPVIQQDDAFRAIAVRNIRSHPIKNTRNWVANVGRLLFGFPASYLYQREQTLWRMPHNCVLVTVMLASACLVMLTWRRVPTEVAYLLLISAVYLGLSSLVSAYPRHFYVIVPMILVWCAHTLYGSIAISLRAPAVSCQDV